jgi:short-subunit dehydrogenase
MNLEGTWVWVTGASSGLGRELARQLAFEHKANVIISARRADRLEALKSELELKAGVQVRALVTDLSDMSHVERALAEVKGIAALSAVILNAGVTHFGHHHELGWPAFHSMLNTNAVSAARITTELAEHAQAKKTKLSIMLVTSLQGFIPIPYFAAYSGTKGFVTNFGLALGHELKSTNVRVQVFAPSGIATEQTAGERFASLASFLMSPEVVARKVLNALKSGKVLGSSMGFWERVGLAFERLLPREVAIVFMGRLYRRSMDQAAARASLPESAPSRPG